MLMKRLIFAIAIGMLIAAAACNKVGQPSRPRVALLMKAQSNPFFQSMEKGAQEAAKESDVELLVYYLPAETAADSQVAQVEDVIAKQVNAILIAPSGSSAIVPALLKANEAKIPVINLDNRIDAQAAASAGLKIAAFVGPDNVEGARLSCREMLRRVGKDARIAILEGIPAAVNAQQRKQGCVEIIAQIADAKLAASQTANWELDQANTVFTDMLQAHPDINALFAANDMMALGALQAIKAAGRSGQIVVAGYDNIDTAQATLRDGTMAATVDQHPERIGAEGVRAAARLLKGESIPAEIPIQVELITKEKLR
jgi:ribose transport system substrate-binding protein